VPQGRGAFFPRASASGLGPDDPRPAELSELERYRRVWAWYRANVTKLAGRTDDYAKRSADYIQQLPPPDSVSVGQIEEGFRHVRTNLLEWACRESDCQYKMAAYAGA
jgi:hypothetical protein